MEDLQDIHEGNWRVRDTVGITKPSLLLKCNEKTTGDPTITVFFVKSINKVDVH